MRIRPRREGDSAVLVAMADAVGRVDRWPPHRAGPPQDFVLDESAIAAFVAEDDGRVVGHVALHEHSANAVMTMAADATGLDQSALAVVARLFVSPDHRGRGIGLALLDAAAKAAISVNRQSILDVWIELVDAVALYEHAGWRRLGEVTFAFGATCVPECLHTGNSIRSIVFAAPKSIEPADHR